MFLLNIKQLKEKQLEEEKRLESDILKYNSSKSLINNKINNVKRDAIK